VSGDAQNVCAITMVGTVLKKNENLPEVYVNHVKEIEPVILCLWTLKYSDSVLIRFCC